MALVSIIIATFNSARTLPKVLEAINKQTYPKKNIEILIIDGGSTDSTVSIAKRYDCKIIMNPKVEPNYAKYLGLQNAKGLYVLYIDHDEVFTNIDSIKTRVDIFKKHHNVKAITGNGYSNPPGLHIINRYINEFGDPFSFFIYRLSKNSNFFLPTMYKRFKVTFDTELYSIFDLSTSSEIALIELGAGGGMIDRSYVKKSFDNTVTQYQLVPHLLHLLCPKYPFLGIVKNDSLYHYSSDNFGGYMQKIIWRIKNNIFHTDTLGASGFTGREEFQTPISRLKKLLFLPYAFSILFPCIDAAYLMVTRKDASYCIHVPLTVITASIIVYYYFLKTLGIKSTMMSYDGSTKAYEK